MSGPPGLMHLPVPQGNGTSRPAVRLLHYGKPVNGLGGQNITLYATDEHLGWDQDIWCERETLVRESFQPAIATDPFLLAHLLNSHELASDDDYLLHRILHGVPEGHVDFPQASALPLDSNLDMMGACNCLLPDTTSNPSFLASEL